MSRGDYVKSAVSIMVALSAGFIGSLFTTPSIAGWYQELVKPTLAPPNWIFAPVWTSLFLLMGVAAFLIWKKGLARKDIKTALGLFVFQLALNALWSIIFFGAHAPGWALLEIILLWIAILATMLSFWKISRIAGSLMLPYFLWVTFAIYLNYSIFILNR
jgi:benzodiazapine receptor